MLINSQSLVTVLQGQYKVSDDPDVILSTVLGSCVAMCLYDPERGVGGMNHFLLPNGDGSTGNTVKYGTHAVEVLINDLLKSGASKERLKAKLFGGGHLQKNLNDIGGTNAAFAREFLEDEGIDCVSESLGGVSARRIRFWPATGAAKQLLVPISEVGEAPPPKPAPPPVDDIELF